MFKDQRPTASDVDRFVLEAMDSVPHLEGLLLLWRSAPQPCSAEEIAKQLYIPVNQAGGILDDLSRGGLISRSAAGFFYDSSSDTRNRLIESLDATYRRDLIRISGMIHSKPSASVRAFADAFRFRKERD